MVRVVKDIFASDAVNPITMEKEKISRFTISNDMQMSVQIITYGATISSIKVPDASGKVEDVVLGFENLEGYLSASNPYFGATVGRVCNRVANGQFSLGGNIVKVTRNWNNKHQLHGGLLGFDKIHWGVLAVRNDGISLRHCSPDGDEGYPGEVTATVHFTLTEDNCLHVLMEAETTKMTPVNLTNHSYFNLAGHNAGKDGIYAHSMQIFADEITETDNESIPTGRLTALQGSPYNLRTLRNLGERLKDLLPAIGFDDNYCVKLERPNAVTTVAKASHPPSGRWLEVASNQPGLQFYTANYMPDIEHGDAPIIGKLGAKYAKQGAFCLETQKYPDAVNHANFPSIILEPGEKYAHEVIYKFGTYRA